MSSKVILEKYLAFIILFLKLSFWESILFTYSKYALINMEKRQV